jgi:hypothetical protein
MKNKITPALSEVIARIKQFQISGKRTLTFKDSFECPSDDIISFDHTHLMHHAVTSTCTLGFILRDFNLEFASRFADELLINDKKQRH